jgi:hypothetical protein
MTDGREGGFIKLYRRLESWPLWQAMTALQRMVWIQLLLSANWKDGEAWYGSRRYVVRRGQTSLSETEIARKAKVDRQVVRDAYAKLRAEGAISREEVRLNSETGPVQADQKKNQSPHITTIVNYESFQDYDDSENQSKNQSRTKKEPSENQARTLIEEGEEGEEGKNLLLSPPPAEDGKPAKKARAPKKETDPRHLAFVERLASVFEQARGAKYGFTPRDAKAVTEIIAFANGSIEEAERRWRVALNGIGFRRSDAIYELASKWNAYVGEAPSGVQKVTAAASHQSEFTGGRRAL